MRVFIPTYGRANRQITWNNLPNAIREITVLVVQDREKGQYGKYPTLVLPPEITTIGPTRHYLIHELPYDRICMVDDDLVFATRRKDEPTKFKPSSITDIENMFRAINVHLHESRPHVGVAVRDGANRNTEPCILASRVLRIHGFFLPVLQEFDISFLRVPLMSDFDVTLQLLGLGYENLILNEWCHNQGGSNNSDGGCTEFRTLQRLRESAEHLAELHPGIVKVVKKQTKIAWGGLERHDVRIQWKRKLQSARDASLLDARAGTN